MIELSNISGQSLTYDTVQEVVVTSDKQRFAISPDGKRIRANQGHSVSVNLGLVSCEPPPLLFHGTAVRSIDSIRKKGLLPGSRQHVHLSSDATTATIVGSRHGVPVVLIVRAMEMYHDGFEFWLSDNGVWLTVNVPFRYLDFPNNSEIKFDDCI